MTPVLKIISIFVLYGTSFRERMPPCPKPGGRGIDRKRKSAFLPQMEVISHALLNVVFYSLLISTSRPYHSTLPIQYMNIL